jgi:hypothetical protein
MCGIAGYNCSIETSKLLNPKTFNRLVKAAVLGNLHRGTDATGWFAQYHDHEDATIAGATWAFKAPIEGNKLVNQSSFYPSPVPINLGIHTRAASKDFDPKVNANNHPVEAFGMQVTHNGIIRTNTGYRNSLKNQGVNLDGLPAVDSTCILLHFRHIVKPLDQFDEIVDLINELHRFDTSGYAFNLVWNNTPGLSVLVRGPEYPLHIIADEQKKMWFYSSQKDAAVNMQRCFPKNTFQPVSGNFTKGKAVILLDGLAEWWGDFQVKKSYAYNVSNIVNPKTRVGSDGLYKAYTTPTSYHFTTKPVPVSYADAKVVETDGKGEVVTLKSKDGGYDLEAIEKHFKRRNPGTPRKYQELFWELSTDADEVAAWEPKQNTNTDYGYYMFVGKTELFFDYEFLMKDFYDWSKIDFSKEKAFYYPWTSSWPVENIPEPPVEEPVIPLQDWLKSSLVANEIDCAKYAPEDAKANSCSTPPKQLTANSGGHYAGWENAFSEMLDRGELRQGVTRTQISLQTINKANPNQFHGSYIVPSFKFLKGSWCDKHNVMMVNHPNPHLCDAAIDHALAVLGSCNSLDRYIAIYGPTSLKNGPTMPVKGCKHVWVENETVRFVWNHSEYSYVHSEKCTKCNGELSVGKIGVLDEVLTS